MTSERRENVIRPMDLDLLAPKQVDWNKTYFQFLTELFLEGLEIDLK